LLAIAILLVKLYIQTDACLVRQLLIAVRTDACVVALSVTASANTAHVAVTVALVHVYTHTGCCH